MRSLVVVEKDGGKPDGIINVGRASGFPTPLKRDYREKNKSVVTNLRKIESTVNNCDSGIISNSEPTELSGPILNSITSNQSSHAGEEDYQRLNDHLISKLTPEDLHHAMQEIQSLLSARNVERLKAPREIIHVVTETNKFPITQSTDDNSRKLSFGVDSTRPNAPLHSISKMDERFDLEGRKIIVREQASKALCRVILDHIRGPISNSKRDIDEKIERLADGLIHRALKSDCDLCVSVDAIALLSKRQPQSGLHHHQDSPDDPGYTLKELCEVSDAFEYRSAVPYLLNLYSHMAALRCIALAIQGSVFSLLSFSCAFLSAEAPWSWQRHTA